MSGIRFALWFPIPRASDSCGCVEGGLPAASEANAPRRSRTSGGIEHSKTESAAPHAEEVPKLAAPREQLVQLCIGLERLGDFTAAIGRRRREMIWNPWMFGLEAVQQGWQAQSALAFRLMRSFAGGVPDQTTSSPLSPHTAADDIKAQEEIAAIAHVREAPAAIIDGQEAPAAIADARRRKAPKVLPASKKTSRVKARSVSKRAAASQNSGRKAVRRSARKPR
jgi:hypothetical protein